MKKFINEKVISEIYGEGIVRDIICSDVLCKIIIQFGDDIELFDLQKAFRNNLITFEKEELNDEIIDFYDKKIGMTRTLSGMPIFIPRNELSLTRDYGNNPIKIYEELQLIYTWITSLMTDLSEKGIMYAYRVDGEMSVLFLKNTSKEVDLDQNIKIKYNKKLIELIIDEETMETNHYFSSMFYGKILVFNESKEGQYNFIGIYKKSDILKNMNNQIVLCLDKVSTKYPTKRNPFD